MTGFIIWTGTTQRNLYTTYSWIGQRQYGRVLHIMMACLWGVVWVRRLLLLRFFLFFNCSLFDTRGEVDHDYVNWRTKYLSSDLPQTVPHAPWHFVMINTNACIRQLKLFWEKVHNFSFAFEAALGTELRNGQVIMRFANDQSWITTNADVDRMLDYL